MAAVVYFSRFIGFAAVKVDAGLAGKQWSPTQIHALSKNYSYALHPHINGVRFLAKNGITLELCAQKCGMYVTCVCSVGDYLDQMIYKSRFKSFPMTYDFALNQFSSHDLSFWLKSNF